jgi:hypothetical protein
MQRVNTENESEQIEMEGESMKRGREAKTEES